MAMFFILKSEFPFSWLKLSYLTLLMLIHLLINVEVNKRIICQECGCRGCFLLSQ